MSTDTVGKSVHRQDALAKVTGEARYVGDIKVEGCLAGKVLRSPHAHARIICIDAGKPRKLPGVLVVITGRDLPGGRYGQYLADQPVLAREQVLFAGERVAAVAAVDADTALEALALIEVAYEELPALLDPVQAMQPGAPLLHPGFAAYRNAHVTNLPNVADHAVYGIGDPETGLREADVVIEHTFRTSVVHQGYLEPHATIVQIGNEQTVKLWSTNKQPFKLRNDLAGLLSLSMDKMEVVYTDIGGDFGGKGAIMDEPVCYYLALAAGRPVRMSMTMREELMAANPRRATIITLN